MIEEGSRVRLRADSILAQQHAGLSGVVGIVGAVINGRRWHRLDTSEQDRQADRTAHVRFRQPPVVLMAVPVEDLEPVDNLDPVRSA